MTANPVSKEQSEIAFDAWADERALPGIDYRVAMVAWRAAWDAALAQATEPSAGHLVMDLCTVLDMHDYAASDDSDYVETVARELTRFGWVHRSVQATETEALRSALRELLRLEAPANRAEEDAYDAAMDRARWLIEQEPA